MTAVGAGSNQFVAAAIWSFKVQEMYATYVTLLTPPSLQSTRSSEPLRQYARLEYGRDGTVWFLTQASPRRPRTRPIRERLRYWINSFRGFAVLDVKGPEGSSRP